jgi:syntaxin 7
MAYTDDVDLEAQLPYSDSPEFDQLSESVATGLFDLNSKIVKLRGQVKAFDKKVPDIAAEERAVELADRTRDAFKSLSDNVRELQLWPDAQPSQKFTQQKLSREFSTALTEFQSIQRDIAQKQRMSIIRAKTSIAEARHGAEQDNIIDQPVDEERQRLQLEQEELDAAAVSYQQALIEEREAEIRGIEQGIQELNEIFTDLGTIVTEQGTIIDNIEANIYNVASATQDAAHQLTKAARYQRSSRGRACCLLLILSIVLAVILLGVSCY